MSRTVANAFSGDTGGYIFFSGYYVSGSVNFILSSADNATNNNIFYIGLNLSGELRILSIIGATVNNLNGNTVISNGQYYHGWVHTDGFVWTANLNGVTQTLTATSGSNNGFFFNDVPNRDNLAIGSILRNTPLYGNTQVNKLYYNNTALSASDLWKTEQFFANPLNYD
jgi:hypothetical protein